MQIRKHLYFRFIVTLVVLMFFAFGVNAQTGTLKGTVIDEKTKEPIPFANVVIEKGGKLITGTSANIEGNYFIKTIPSGIYNLRVTDLFHYTMMVAHIIIYSDSITNLDFKLKEKKTDVYPIVDYWWKIPLISKDPIPFGQSYSSGEINKMAW